MPLAFLKCDAFRFGACNSDDSELAHLVTWSDFRNCAEYWVKNESGNWAKADAQPRRPTVRFGADKRRAIDIGPESVDAACHRFLGYMTVSQPSEVRDTTESM